MIFYHLEHRTIKKLIISLKFEVLFFVQLNTHKKYRRETDIYVIPILFIMQTSKA